MPEDSTISLTILVHLHTSLIFTEITVRAVAVAVTLPLWIFYCDNYYSLLLSHVYCAYCVTCKKIICNKVQQVLSICAVQLQSMKVHHCGAQKARNSGRFRALHL